MLFQQYTASDVDNIYHPYIVNEWKANIYKVDYKYNCGMGVYVPSVKSELAQIINADYWPKWLIKDIEWFQFDVILKHAAFHARGPNIILHSLFKLFRMLMIILCNEGKCNDKLICIKCNNCGRYVAYHLESEEKFNSVITNFFFVWCFTMLDYCGFLRTRRTISLKWI